MSDFSYMKLRLMNGQAFSPSEVEEHLISSTETVAITQIFKKNERKIYCRLEDNTNIGDPHVIARLHTGNSEIALEPCTDNVTVETLRLHNNSKLWKGNAVKIPRSTHYRHTYIFLRHLDTIDFPVEGLKVEVSMHEEQEPPAPRAVTSTVDALAHETDSDAIKPEVQVKSSNVEPVTVGHEASDSDSGSDDDLDKPLSALSARTPAEITPATSRPTELMIKETPKHNRSVPKLTNSDEDDAPFSTAPRTAIEGAEMDGLNEQAILADPESPSLKVHKAYTLNTSQAQAGAELMDNIDSTPSDAGDDVDFNTPKKALVTYGKGASRPGAPQMRSRTPRVRGETPIGSGGLDDWDVPHAEEVEDEIVVATSELPYTQGMAAGVEIEDAIDESAVPSTSEPMDVHDVAAEVARRTPLSRNGKRKVVEEQYEDDTSSGGSSKKQKTGNAYGGDINVDEAENGLAEQDEPNQPKPALKTSTGKLKQVSRRSTQESSDEIVVTSSKPLPKTPGLQKSSPEVVIKQPRFSETPSSAASSSILSGKGLKILITGPSKVKDNKAVEKWLKARNANIVGDVLSRRSHFICVVNKEHTLRTPKVLRSLALGKLVVVDTWLTDSKKAGNLLDPDDYIHDSVKDTIMRDRSTIFNGMNLYFTNELTKKVYIDAWRDIQELVKEAGASHVETVGFGRLGAITGRNDMVFFGSEQDDADVTRLIKGYGRTVYHRDLLVESIIAGELDLENEKYVLPASAEEKKGRR